MQQIMSRLSTANRILYVEPAKSFLSFLKEGRGKWSPRTKLRQLSKNLSILTLPKMFFPFQMYGRLGALSKANAILQYQIIRRFIRNMNKDRILLWVYCPTVSELVDRIQCHLSVYHCADEWSAYVEDKALRKATAEMDARICQTVDVVFVGSKPMLAKKKALNSNTFYVPHAADVQHFAKASRPETLVASELEEIGHPIVGLIGMMDGTRIDVDMLSYITSKHPEWSFVFVGKIWHDLDIRRLTEYSNVHFLGMRPIDELPRFLKAFDVCIIPYKINNFTFNIYPLKLHEYMASGKPIVCTPIPACLEYKDVIEIAESKEDFCKRIETVLNGEIPERAERRKLIAWDNSWEKRITDKSEIILKAWEAKAK